MGDIQTPDDFEMRRARWIAETQEALQRLMERCGMAPPDPESLTGPDPADTPRVMIVGIDMGKIPDRMMAHRGGDVLIVRSDVPICRDRDLGLSLGARGLGRAIAAALSEPVLEDALVRLPEKPKLTKREWRERMKGMR